jgi:hypothetical protein
MQTLERCHSERCYSENICHCGNIVIAKVGCPSRPVAICSAISPLRDNHRFMPISEKCHCEPQVIFLRRGNLQLDNYSIISRINITKNLAMPYLLSERESFYVDNLFICTPID